MLGTWFYEHPYCTDRDILFLFLLTNVLIVRRFGLKGLLNVNVAVVLQTFQQTQDDHVSVVLSLLDGTYMIQGQFPVWLLTLLVGFLLSTIMFCTTKNDCPPPYHSVSPPRFNDRVSL